MAIDAQNWSAYWQGRRSETSLEGPGIEVDAAIAAFWRGHLEGHPKDAALTDLACGSGTVAAHAVDLGMTTVTALDYSQEALDLVAERLPGVTTRCASVLETGLPQQSQAVVVSQFGLEYGGIPAFAEAARLVAPGGRLLTLSHYRGGGIDIEVAADLTFAQAMADTGYGAAAHALVDTAFQNLGMTDETLTGTSAFADFMAASRRLVPLAQERPQSIATQTMHGFAQMMERRRHYAAQDLHDWLAGIDAEIDAYRGRLAEMQAAALDTAALASIADTVRGEGLGELTTAPFTAGTDDEPPIAWIIEAARP